jgi:hypothetical protein
MALALVNRHAPGQEEAVFAGNAIRFYRLDLSSNSNDELRNEKGRTE